MKAQTRWGIISALAVVIGLGAAPAPASAAGLPVVTSTDHGGIIGSIVPLSGTFADAADGTELVLYVDPYDEPGDGETFTIGDAIGRTTPMGPNGAWSFPLTGLAHGVYDFRVAVEVDGSETGAIIGNFYNSLRFPILQTPVSVSIDPSSLQHEYTVPEDSGMRFNVSRPIVDGLGVRVYINGSLYGVAACGTVQDPPLCGYPVRSDLGVGTYTLRADLVFRGSVLAQSTATLKVVAPAPPPTLPKRIYGADRYLTSVEIAKQYDKFHDAEVVFLATGENFPDALSAAAAAGFLGAPVLLTPKKSLTAEVKKELQVLDPDRVVVMGSTAAISSTVYNQVVALFGAGNVSRINGVDRYDTMRQLVYQVWEDSYPGVGFQHAQTVVVATGRNFPDALSAAPGVSHDGGPVVLVDGSKSSIPAETIELLQWLKPYEVVIAGGTPAVSKGIENQLKSVFTDATLSHVIRVAGPDRYETSRLLNVHFFSGGSYAFMATGKNYPDALSGAALAASMNSPLYTTPGTCVPAKTAKLFSIGGMHDDSTRVLLGSSSVIKPGGVC